MSDYDPNTPITMAIPSPDSGVDSAIYAAKLRAENADLRATVERLTRELHRLAHGNTIEGDGVCRHELVAHEALREVTRLRGVVHTYMTSHDEQIAQERLALIGQSVRERDTARRWSRLWHAEARRLWREVQGLHGMIDDLRGLPQEDPEEFVREIGGDP